MSTRIYPFTEFEKYIPEIKYCPKCFSSRLFTNWEVKYKMEKNECSCGMIIDKLEWLDKSEVRSKKIDAVFNI